MNNSFRIKKNKMERKFHYNEDKEYNQVRYLNINKQIHRNHDLPAIRGLDFRYYYWIKNGKEHRMNILSLSAGENPSCIFIDGSKRYLKDDKFQRKNNLPCFYLYDGIIIAV